MLIKVLADDIIQQLDRIERGALASTDEHVDLLGEIARLEAELNAAKVKVSNSIVVASRRARVGSDKPRVVPTPQAV